MSRLPPRSTRTDTLFPYTTLFRSFLQFLVLPTGEGELRDRRLVARLAARQLHEGGEIAAVKSEEHTSELQSLMRISYAVFCLKKKKPKTPQQYIELSFNTSRSHA